jgi:hypothetical protein
MTRNTLNRFVAAAAAMWVLAASALAQTSSPMTINVPQLNEAEFQRWVGKSNAYVELLNDSTRALDSLRRYASWVDMKLGPTGKERYISYGLYSVDPAGAERVIAKARAAADAPPPIPPLDEAARRWCRCSTPPPAITTARTIPMTRWPAARRCTRRSCRR